MADWIDEVSLGDLVLNNYCEQVARARLRAAHAAHCTPLTPKLAERIAEELVRTVEDPNAEWDGTAAGIARFILRVRDGASGNQERSEGDV